MWILTQRKEGFSPAVTAGFPADTTFRGFQGTDWGGRDRRRRLRPDLPSGEQAHVKSIYVAGAQADGAGNGQPVTLQLDREVDVSRGCVLVKGTRPAVTNRLEATMLWMDDDR